LLIESSDVTFRHLAISTDQGVVSGICLSYRTRVDAESFFAFIHRYLSASGRVPRRLVEVQATKTSVRTCLFSIEVGLGDTLRRIDIAGVERRYIDHVRRSLKVFTYYLLAASYELPEGGTTLLPLTQNHMFLNRITIDNVVYAGNPDCKFPWQTLVQSDYMLYQSNE